MSRPSTASDPPERLRTISRSLQELHRALLDYQRRDYERSFGRVSSDFYVLTLAADDPQFAWIKALSNEMIRIDVALSGGDVDDVELRLVGTRLRYLLAPTSDGTPFQSRYDAAMQSNPEIIMAHAAVMRSLPLVRRVTLFRGQAAPESMSDDSAPGIVMRVHRPGELVPGHGDHGYRALAAIAELDMEPGSSTAMHAQANEEIVFWVPAGEAALEDEQGTSYRLDQNHVAIVNAGTGVKYRERAMPQEDPLRMIQVYVRPNAVSLEPEIQHGELPSVSPGKWRDVVGPEDDDAPFSVRNRLSLSDLALPAGGSAPLPRREGWDTYIYPYDGEVEIDGVPIGAFQSGLVIAPDSVPISATTDAQLAVILIDRSSKITRAGIFARTLSPQDPGTGTVLASSGLDEDVAPREYAVERHCETSPP